MYLEVLSAVWKYIGIETKAICNEVTGSFSLICRDNGKCTKKRLRCFYWPGILGFGKISR